MNFHLPPATRTGQDVAALLRRLIHSGELPEGSKLPPQRELAAQLGVSRNALREALAALEALNYVTTQRGAHGGTSVSALGANPELWAGRMRATIDEWDDLAEFRMAVESRAALLAAGHRTEAHLAAMRAAVQALQHGISRQEFRTHDAAFHSQIAAAARSPRLEEAIRDARGELFPSTDNLNYLPSITDMRDEHAALLDAIEAGDGQRAARLMVEHIENSRDVLRAILLADRPGTPPANSPAAAPPSTADPAHPSPTPSSGGSPAAVEGQSCEPS